MLVLHRISSCCIGNPPCSVLYSSHIPFFATSHDRGPCDGVAVVVKRHGSQGQFAVCRVYIATKSQHPLDNSLSAKLFQDEFKAKTTASMQPLHGFVPVDASARIQFFAPKLCKLWCHITSTLIPHLARAN